jgi:hypothetical protein
LSLFPGALIFLSFLTHGLGVGRHFPQFTMTHGVGSFLSLSDHLTLSPAKVQGAQDAFTLFFRKMKFYEDQIIAYFKSYHVETFSM